MCVYTHHCCIVICLFSLQCVKKDVNGTITFPIAPNDTMSAFTIGLQMPLLLFMDYEVRAGLMQAVAESINAGAGSGNPVMNTENLCIYRVQQYVPATFNERLVKAYRLCIHIRYFS